MTEVTLTDIHKASRYWYGACDIDNCCLVENRLNRGELPWDGFPNKEKEKNGD